MTDARDDGSYQERLGERLRSIRTQQGLTLQQVEERSGGRWKAVVIGAYERGDRAISATKLAELARFYGVPVAELLPEPRRRDVADGSTGNEPIVLDLGRLAGDDLDPALVPVSRYASAIQLQRGDYNGRMLTLRAEDVRALATVLGITAEDLLIRLDEEQVLVER